MDKPVMYISNTKTLQYYCKKCHKANNHVIKLGKNSYCESCVPENLKGKYTKVNQMREVVG